MGTLSHTRIRVEKPQGGGAAAVAGKATWGPFFGGGSPYYPALIGSNFIPEIDLTFTGTSAIGSNAISAMGLTYTGTGMIGSNFIPAIALSFSGTGDIGSVLPLSWQAGKATLVGQGDWIVGKDTWVDTVSLCSTDTNHDGTDLQLDSTAATSKDIYLSWDMTQINSGVTTTMVSGGMVLDCNKNPLLSSVVNIFGIANGSENWNESTLKCSTRPAASGTILGSFVVTTTSSGAGVVATWDPNGVGSAVLSRFKDRMGSGNCTLLLQMSTAASSTQFTTRGSSGGAINKSGPELVLKFTTTG